MSRMALGSLCAALSLSVGFVWVESRAAASALEEKEIRLGDYTIYVHARSGTVIAIGDRGQYFGTAKAVKPFVRKGRDESSASLAVVYTKATSDDRQGLLVHCDGGEAFFYSEADDEAWRHFPDGKDTVVPVCPASGGSDECRRLALPCAGPHAMPAVAGVPKANGQAPRTNGQTPKEGGGLLTQLREAAKAALPPAAPPEASRPGAGHEGQVAAAPRVTLIEGVQVRPDEAMVFTRSQLIEEGSAVASMNEFAENINTVRYNINSYRIGYTIAADKAGERFIFSGPVKGWRATSTADLSTWPPFTYPESRNEAMRRARLLEPILLSEPIDEMNNLRVYYFPVMVGHDGRDYQIDPAALAFFIDPKTGQRMTVILVRGRAYGSVGRPLSATSQLYIQEVNSYSAGFLGMGTARIPRIFYSRSVQFDVQPFAAGDNLERLMSTVLDAHKNVLSADDFRALFTEMSRYTDGSTP